MMNWIPKRDGLLITWTVLILMSLLFHPGAPARAQEGAEKSPEQFETTFAELAYSDRVLRGPLDYTYYSFNLPADWTIQSGSYVNLLFDYNFAGQEDMPVTLEVSLNGHVLRTENLRATQVYDMRVSLPRDLFYSFDDHQLNSLRLRLSVNAECEQARLASLTVLSASILNLVYVEGEIPIDLALYPKPIYQAWGFYPSAARFILPPEVESSTIQAATMIASRLGELSANTLHISTTLATTAQSARAFDEHLIIIGKPDANPILRDLNLPVPLVERQLGLSGRMPERVVPGEDFTRTLVVENSATRQGLSVTLRLPEGVIWKSCSRDAQCEVPDDGLLTWQVGSLTTNGSISTTVQFSLKDEAVVGEEIELTATLRDDEGAPLNADTLTAVVSTMSSASLERSSQDKGKYFFVADGLAVPEQDGLIQAFISPWNDDQVILVVTGLEDEALLRAARALSSETRFPGMSGKYALIHAVDEKIEEPEPPSEDLMFSSLGYGDEVVRISSGSGLRYHFNLPWGSTLAEDAFVALHLSHGMDGVGMDATLQVDLNGIPIRGISLDEENAEESWVKIPLPQTPSEAGVNRLGIKMIHDTEWCVDARDEQAWVVIYNNSFFHLPRETAAPYLSLANFPRPYSSQEGLQNLVFLLSEQPAMVEIEGIVRLAAGLGYAAGGNDFMPRVAVGGDPTAQMWPGQHLILVGRPTTNRYIAALNDVLPQPFYPQTDRIWQQIDSVIYRLPADVSVGMVQTLLAPWDAEQALLVATGTTEEGVGWALDTLIEPRLISQLAGNLAMIRAKSVDSIDTRKYSPGVVPELVGLTPVPTSEPTPTPSPTPTPTRITPQVSDEPPPREDRSFWVAPLLIISAITVIVAALIGWRQARP